MNIRSDIKRKWENEGWTLSITKKCHLRLLHPKASYPVITSGTPSDRRALQNCEAEMRRSLRIGLQSKAK
jgi:hypothetical protein